ncbi:ATP-binding cassette domain-containing protein, partial [Escherichia coli]|uniref:ATP-binding cassette domain-containing protein n=1 Tax=Escherichia coli TaxID=562 RepID=UPI00102DACA2
MSLLTVSQLSVARGPDIALVDKVSFQLNAGEMLGLVGESGSGKTVTCRAMMRLLPGQGLRISGGEVRLGGRDLLTLSDAQMSRVRGREIGMIFQNPASHLNPCLLY